MQVNSLKTAQATSVVLGLGATGLSCLEYLQDKQSLIACDDHMSLSRQSELQKDFSRVEFLSVADCMQRTDIREVIASPGISDNHPLVSQALAASIPVICDIEIFAKAEKAPVIAVTGTNGKSTVVSWLQFVLNSVDKNCLLAGNIGIPALTAIVDEHEVSILELSSFQLERTFSLAPKAALILNLSSDHLDRYHNKAAYQEAKERIYNNAQVIVINRDTQNFKTPLSIRQTMSFGLSESEKDFGIVVQSGKRYLSYQGEALVACSELPLIGEHNVSNALAVLACAQIVGVKPSDAISGLLKFKGLPHRTELVAERNGVRYINDSKATNAGATIAAVDGDLQNILLIAGGDAKKAELAPLVDALNGKLKHAILLGQDAKQLENLLSAIAPCTQVENLESAVKLASGLAKSGDTVLLSPACSSLDMFKSYIQRGEEFIAAVEGLNDE